MKRTVTMLALILAALMLLTACGSSASAPAYYDDNGGDYYDGGTAGYAAMDEAAYEAEEWYEEDWDEPAMEEAPMEAEKSADLLNADGVTEGAGESTSNLSEKIIYTANAEIETTEFDSAVETVNELMTRYGAFVESSSVTGINLSESYNGSRSNRTADFTLRVPKDKYSAITGALSEVGNVTYLSSDAQNITTQYMDTQSRLTAYETEEARLLEFLAQAETVEDMITVESRLSDIRYEKEWLTSQLKNWDNQVSYSTVYIHLREVRMLTPEPEPEPETYGQQLISGFLSTLKGMGRAIKSLFLGFVSALPVLIPLAVIVIVIILLVRRSSKKRAANRAKIPQSRPQPFPGPVPQPRPAPAPAAPDRDVPPTGKPEADAPPVQTPEKPEDAPEKPEE